MEGIGLKKRFTDLVPARFIERKNRFIALVEYEGCLIDVHVPSTGRLDTVLVPGTSCWLKPAPKQSRKTRFSLFLAEKDGYWVCVDAMVANAIAVDLLQQGAVPGIPKGKVEPEVRKGNSRFDFRVIDEAGRTHYIEVKSVNLALAGRAYFPDAPTVRGRKHLEELARLQKEGEPTHVLFIVQRGDAEDFAPYRKVDPLFSEALRKCDRAGTNVQAALTHVTPEGIEFRKWLPVVFA